MGHSAKSIRIAAIFPSWKEESPLDVALLKTLKAMRKARCYPTIVAWTFFVSVLGWDIVILDQAG